ncbi:MAG: hypothetical protein ACI9VR_000122 [Cognaticolwellia sp.]|jgi:hypothetical protein
MLILALTMAGCGQKEQTERVIAGGSFNCLLSTKGKVWCEDYERAEAREIANQMDTETVFKEVLAGAYAACGLTADNTVHCWGNPSSELVTSVPAGTVEALYADRWGACVIHPDEASTCWSMQAGGELPKGQGILPNTIVGADTTLCGLDLEGQVHCWGAGLSDMGPPPSGTFVELVDAPLGFAGRTDSGRWVYWGFNQFGVGDIPNELEVEDLTFGIYHGCALDPNGKVHCWGAIDHGEEPYRWQLDVPQDETFVSIDANLWHTCGVTTEGDVRCWGCNTWRFPDYWDPEDHCNDPVPPWDQ